MEITLLNLVLYNAIVLKKTGNFYFLKSLVALLFDTFNNFRNYIFKELLYDLFSSEKNLRRFGNMQQSL